MTEYEDTINHHVQQVLANIHNNKHVVCFGNSQSGKSTLIQRIKEQLPSDNVLDIENHDHEVSSGTRTMIQRFIQSTKIDSYFFIDSAPSSCALQQSTKVILLDDVNVYIRNDRSFISFLKDTMDIKNVVFILTCGTSAPEEKKLKATICRRTRHVEVIRLPDHRQASKGKKKRQSTDSITKNTSELMIQCLLQPPTYDCLPWIGATDLMLASLLLENVSILTPSKELGSILEEVIAGDVQEYNAFQNHDWILRDNVHIIKLGSILSRSKSKQTIQKVSEKLNPRTSSIALAAGACLNKKKLVALKQQMLLSANNIDDRRCWSKGFGGVFHILDGIKVRTPVQTDELAEQIRQLNLTDDIHTTVIQYLSYVHPDVMTASTISKIKRVLGKNAVRKSSQMSTKR
jgi:hypothetical protein